MRTYACAGLSALLISTVTGSQALAGAFQLNERSAPALGASLSGSVSSARDVTFATFNPAALSTVETFEAGGNFSYISPISNGTIKDGDDAGTKLDADRVGLVPSLAVGYRVNQDLVVGLTIYSPFGLKTEYSRNSPVQFDARKSELSTIIVSPMLSYDVLDNLTFGASFDVLYADAKLTSNGGPIGDVNLDGDDFGYGFSVGLLFEPVKGTHIGAAYHHGYDLDVDTKTFLAQSGTAEASLPNWVQIGITQDITDDLRVMAEGRWANWSKFNSIDVTTPTLAGGPLGSVSDVQNYEDAFFISVGAEYDVTDRLTIRGGMAWDETPTTDNDRTVRVPDEDRLWLSAGASYNVTDSITADFAYSYLHALKDPDVTLRNGPNAGDHVEYDSGAHIFSIGGSFHF